jgi:signal transduction histidine kinase
VLDDLRELSRGIHPAVLSKGGLRPALRALARRSSVPVVMDVRIHRKGLLHVRVRDDGIGGADLARGSGLIGLRDRIEALGGTFTVASPRGEGTTVSCQLPIATGGLLDAVGE